MHISKEDIYLRIGRNIVIFQQIEIHLKKILAGHKISGPMSKIQKIKKSNISEIKNKTLGGLINNFISNCVKIKNDQDDFFDSDNDIEITEPHISITFGITTDPDEFEKRKTRLNDLLSQRNELVHNLLLEYNINEENDRTNLASFLDNQFEQASYELYRLEIEADTLVRLRLDLENSFADPLVKNMIINPHLIHWLTFAVDNYSRKDGWTDISIAGKILHERIPDKYKESLDFYKVKKLSDLLTITELFDLNKETNENCNSRLFFKFRCKPNKN